MSFDVADIKSGADIDDLACSDDVTGNAANSIDVKDFNVTTDSVKISSLPQLLYDNIKLNQFDDALKLLKASEYEEFLEYNSLDIVPIISRIMREDFCTFDTESCIEEMLNYIALISNTKEVLIVLLEEAANFRSTKQFRVLLRPFQTLLMNQISSSAKANTFTWVFSAINKHASVLPYPKYDSLEADERKLLDADSDQVFVKNTYLYLLDFYEPFFNKVMLKELIWPEKDITTKIYFSYYLLNLFDKPLAFIDVYKSKEDKESALYTICTKYVNMISSLVLNPYKYFELIKARKECSEEFDEDYKEDEFELKLVSQLSLGVYFYFIIGQSMNVKALPCVYAAEHVYLSCIPLCLHLIEKNGIFTIHKGLILLESLLNKLEDNSLPQISLEIPNHLNVYKFLVDIMTHCGSKECRILALKCFKDWIRKFDYEGKYQLFTTIFSTVPHSGIQGVLIHELKENVSILRSADRNDDNFSGLRLQNLIRLACKLPSGETTDLLEWFDKIMGALNLLIFICICDKNNDLCFTPILPLVFTDFLEPLENALRITKGHYKLKQKELEEGKNETKSVVEVEISGDFMSGIPKEKEMESILQSLNCLDIMHSTWARAYKVVTDFKNILNTSAIVN